MDIITSQFENLRMDEDETITQFSARVSDVVNKAANIGDPFVDVRVIKKVLRSLPDRFHAKVTAIREAKDVSELQLDTLMGNLETYELELSEDKKYQQKKKSVAFKTEVEVTVPHSDEDRDDDYTSLYAKHFNKSFKKMLADRRRRFSSPREDDDGEAGPSEQFQKKNSFKPNNGGDNKKDILCRECGGRGHIARECANTVKRNKKSYVATFSDEESSESEDDQSSKVCAFKSTAGDTSSNSDSDDEATESEMERQYKNMYEKWCNAVEIHKRLKKEKNDTVAEMVEVRKTVKILVDEKKDLLKKVEELNRENLMYKAMVDSLKEKDALVQSELTHLKKQVTMLGPGTSTLDKILSTPTNGSGKYGLGYRGVTKSSTKTGTVEFVKATATATATETRTVPVPHRPRFKKGGLRKKFTPTCHYCGGKGHIRPECVLFHKSPNKSRRRSRITTLPTVKQIWVEKTPVTCNVASLSLTANATRQGCHTTPPAVKKTWVRKTAINKPRDKYSGESKRKLTSAVPDAVLNFISDRKGETKGMTCYTSLAKPKHVNKVRTSISYTSKMCKDTDSLIKALDSSWFEKSRSSVGLRMH